MNSMCRDNKRNSELYPNLTTTRKPEHAGLFSSSLHYSVHQQWVPYYPASDTHGLIIARQWALPLSVALLPTATGSYAGVIRSAVGSLNREINVCSTIGPRGLRQTREEPELCATRASSLSSCLVSLLSLSLHLHFSLIRSTSSSSFCCNPSSLSFYMHLHSFLFSLCPWLSFLSRSLSFVPFLWFWVQSHTRTGDLQLLINDYFQRWQESTARERETLRKEEHKDGGRRRQGYPLSLVWGIKYKSQCIIRTGWTSLTTP